MRRGQESFRVFTLPSRGRWGEAMVEDIFQSKNYCRNNLAATGTCSTRLGVTSQIQILLTDGHIVAYQLVSISIDDQREANR